MRSSSGCCPGLGKPLGFQPVVACTLKSLNKNPKQNALFLRVLPWARETIGLSARFCLCIKIFRRILTENAQQYVALQEGFIGDRIGDARNLN